MSRPGRNDLCHCGSGKKYKKCHLEADERSRLITRTQISEVEEAVPPLDRARFPGLAELKNIKELLGQAGARGWMQNCPELRKMAAQAEPLLEYMERQEKIQAASTELELHRSEFEKFNADHEGLGDLANTLFREEGFASLRFTAVDIKRAFDEVGYPAMMAPDVRTVEIFRKAILLLATEDRRREAALSLLSRLPEFVSAGRYNEAWLIQLSAYETLKATDQTNLFFFQMFAFGYDAWAAKKRAHEEALLGELGIDLDRLKGMTMDQIDEWLAAQKFDVAENNALEAFFQAHPDLRAESVANLQAMERNSSALLQREDCQFLLLPAEELEPWLNRFNELAAEERAGGEAPQGNLSEEDVDRIFTDWLLPLMREMAESIFTPERIQQLVSRLKQYRTEKIAAGDMKTATTATGAINSLEREDQPGFNTFLIALCFASIEGLIREQADERVASQA